MAMTKPVTRFKCTVCGKLTAGKMPNPGAGWGPADTSARFPRKHRDKKGKVCKGVYRFAEWIDVWPDGVEENFGT